MTIFSHGILSQKERKKFTNRMRLEKLLKDDPRPFKCTECPKMYANPSTLHRHKFVHSQVKSFKCDVCGKAFGTAPALEVHKTTHTKPYQCQICCQGYKVQSHLVKHMEKEHTNSIQWDVKSKV